MAKHRLSDITVTHISLVKAGANKKRIIYKSAEAEPIWQKDIEIKKSDLKKGIVYGIVYSPDEVDTQGDFAKAEEIEKAAYGFMKAKNIDNIDKNHTFKKEDAYVCESWIIRKSDPMFPNEKPGSWAVGIKIESEELKKQIEKGEIQALSMAGAGRREEVAKMEDLASVIKKTLIDIFTKGDEMAKEKKEVKKEDYNDLQEMFKSALNEALTPFKKEIVELKKQNEDLSEELKKHQDLFDKSAQILDLTKKQTKKDSGSIVA